MGSKTFSLQAQASRGIPSSTVFMVAGLKSSTNSFNSILTLTDLTHPHVHIGSKLFCDRNCSIFDTKSKGMKSPLLKGTLDLFKWFRDLPPIITKHADAYSPVDI